MTSRRSRLLPELWLGVFDHLPRQNIPAVTLTCHSFRQLAQPLLFRSLTFCPFLVSGEDKMLPKKPQLDRTMDRLEFSSSNRISHAVHTCRILPQSNLIPFPAPQDTNDHNVILDAILSLLPHFVNLRELSFFFLDFSGVQIMQLCQLHKLDSLLLTQCNITMGVPPSSPLRVKKVEVSCDSLSPLAQMDVSIFHPHHLEFLSFNENDSAEHFLRLATSPNSELSLRSLCVPSSLELFSVLFPFLANCPALQELRLIRSGDKSYFEVKNLFIPSSWVQRPLSGFHGPYQVLPIFVQGNELRRLSLWDAQPSNKSFIHPDILRSTLHQSADLIRQVDTLEVDVVCINEIVITTIFGLFQNLKSLFVCTDRIFRSGTGIDCYSLKNLLEALLEFKLPPTLKKLRIRSRWHGLPSNEEERYLDLKQRIIDTYPALRFQRLDEYELILTQGCEYAV